MSLLHAPMSAATGPLAGSSADAPSSTNHTPGSLDQALRQIALGAERRDGPRSREFPTEPFAELRRARALAFNAQPGPTRPPAHTELDLVRRVAAADGSVGRIFDGHLNAVERLAVQAPEAIRDAELGAVASGTLLAGIWGGDPTNGEGPPASVVTAGGVETLGGVKTFCSGAGGVQRAIVIARDPDGGPPLSVWVDVSDPNTVEIDRSWYRAHGLAASASHRVIFHSAPVIARIGGPGAISAQPWFGRDALRTAASWAGMADTACRAALECLAGRPVRTELEALAAGRILTTRRTIDVWLDHCATAMDEPGRDLNSTALHARTAIAAACRELVDEAARACGSHPFARAAALDRAKRDLDLFLLQHRLEPKLARHGAEALDRLAAGKSEWSLGL
jgi:hypothetical protein